MSNVIKLGAGAAVFAVVAVVGGNSLKEQRATAIERFALTELELPIMDACEDTVSRHNIEFKSGVKSITGCGCIAREIADSASTSEYTAATAVLSAVIAGGDSDTTPEAFEKGLRAAQSANGLSEIRLLGHVDKATAAIQHCSKHESHMSEEDLAGADTAKREALDRLVAEGHMTRAEADARLARMQQ